jgi:hypothetical protein
LGTASCFVYSINGTALERVDEIKVLGVIMDTYIEHAACVWSPHQSVHSERLERVQHNFIRYAVHRLPWRVWLLPAYDARCLLIGLEVLSDRRIVASALFTRDILVGRVDCPDRATI